MKTRVLLYLGAVVAFIGCLVVIKADGGQEDVLVLSEKNTVSLRMPISDFSVKQTGVELLNKSHSLKKSTPIFLILNSPGGDIDAGNTFIEIAKGLPQKVNTVSLFSASMSFIISQSLDTRYVLASSTLMSHRAYAQGLSGQIPGNLLSRVQTLFASITRLEKSIADRAQMDLNEYRHLIADELWMGGEQAVQLKLADKVVKVSCDASLEGAADEQVIDLIYIKAHVVFHKCPLILSPISVVIEGNTASEKGALAKKILFEILYDRGSFTDDYAKLGTTATVVR